MFLPFVMLGIFVVFMLGVLYFNQDFWNEHWETLTAGSWFTLEDEEKKLPAGNYSISWPRVETEWD